MIGETFASVSPAYIALGTVVLLLGVQVWIRVRYALKVREAGGVHAPALARDPFTALTWLWTIGRAHMQNRFLVLFDQLYSHATPDCPNLVEINVTGGSRYFFTREPEHVKTVLTSKFADYGKGPEFHRVWSPFLGDSIFTTDHQQWHESRNLIRPMFVKNRVSDLEIFERWTSAMINQFPAPGETLDIQDFFYRLTIDVTTEFLLGESVNSISNPRSEFVQAFADVQRMQIMLTALLPIEPLIPRRKYNRGIKVLEEFIVPFIHKALSLDPAELEKISKSERSFTFLHALAAYTRDPKVIRDQIIAVLLAGRDTTAATLSWTFHELAHHPGVYSKLRQEILSIVGTDRAPSYDDLKSMKYLSHTLNETLRLYPAVPFNVRFALTDTTLPSVNPEYPDISVVKGDAVFYSTIAMQRRPDLYPPTSRAFSDPSEFSPDRWDQWQPRPWQYVPFNGGPRICVGQNFALTEMAYVIVRLLQKYESLEHRDDWRAQFHKVEIVGTPGRGVKVALFKPNKERQEKYFRCKE